MRLSEPMISLVAIINCVHFSMYTREVYLLTCLLQHWTKLSKSEEGPWPGARECHAACCLNYGQEHPQLLITGGLDDEYKVVGDAWILDVDNGRWRKVRKKCSCSV